MKHNVHLKDIVYHWSVVTHRLWPTTPVYRLAMGWGKYDKIKYSIFRSVALTKTCCHFASRLPFVYCISCLALYIIEHTNTFGLRTFHKKS